MEYQTIQVVPVSEVLSLIENRTQENIFPEIMTVSQMSKFLNVSISTVYNRSKTGMPHSRQMGVLLFIKADVLEWLRE